MDAHFYLYSSRHFSPPNLFGFSLSILRKTNQHLTKKRKTNQCFFFLTDSYRTPSKVVTEMARSRLVTGHRIWKYFTPAYYLGRTMRLALLFILFLSVSMVVWDPQTRGRDHEVLFFSIQLAALPSYHRV